MPTEIVQTESNGRIYLRVTGDMMLDDALLLEKLSKEIGEAEGQPVTIDLADLDFLDSDSAPILRRLQTSESIEIQGLEIFVQSAIDMAERTAQ
jgi:anti-anti-sigma regulatory factor